MGFGNQTEHPAIAIKAPRAASRDDFQGRLSVAAQEFIPEATGRILVAEFDGDGADPLHVHDGVSSFDTPSPWVASPEQCTT